MDLGASEQRYHLNKSNSLDEFKAALQQQQHPNLCVIYADKTGNILLIDNGLFPYINPDYDWNYIVPGDTSATLWEPKFMPMDSILQVQNPPSGYVFHANGSGFNSTADEDNPEPKNYNKTMGYILENGARNLRFKNLIKQYDKLSYEDLKDIKYAQQREFPYIQKQFRTGIIYAICLLKNILN